MDQADRRLRDHGEARLRSRAQDRAAPPDRRAPRDRRRQRRRRVRDLRARDARGSAQREHARSSSSGWPAASTSGPRLAALYDQVATRRAARTTSRSRSCSAAPRSRSTSSATTRRRSRPTSAILRRVAVDRRGRDRDPDDPRAHRRLAEARRRAEAQGRDPAERRRAQGAALSRGADRGGGPQQRGRRDRDVPVRCWRSTTSTWSAMDALERLYVRLARWEPLKDVYAKKADLAEDPDDKKAMLYVLAQVYDRELGDVAQGDRDLPGDPRSRRRRAAGDPVPRPALRPGRALVRPARQPRAPGRAVRDHRRDRRAQVPHRPPVADPARRRRARDRELPRGARDGSVARRDAARARRARARQDRAGHGGARARADLRGRRRVRQARRRPRGDGRAQRGSARAGRAAAPHRARSTSR